jgi:hypothetical protein
MGAFGLLPNDGQTAEQRRGKFFQHEKPPTDRLNKSGGSGKRLIERRWRERARAFVEVYLFRAVIP